jgi:putative DNA primase/helicase
MLALAGDLEPVHCSTALFDRDPWVLGCPNGVVDLRTGNFRPGKPTDLVSHTTVAPYDPEAQAPRFMRALEQLACGNVELITYLQRIFGLCLTGTVDARSLFILYGPTGANGKTTIVEAFAHMLGDYAQHAPHELLLVHRNGGATPDIARLAGARFVTMSEAPTSSSFNEVTLKQLTGGDTITARHLFRNHQQLTPTWTLMMLANNLPAVKEPGNAMWDRLKIVPCDNRIKPADRKPDLAARLRREAAGILAWAVRGAADYARNGLGRCDAVDEATDEFRRDSEPLLTFIEDCCLVDDGAFTTTKDLHDRYRQWVGPSPSMSMTTFSGRLKTLHHSGRNGRIAGKPSGFFGISLR